MEVGLLSGTLLLSSFFCKSVVREQFMHEFCEIESIESVGTRGGRLRRACLVTFAFVIILE
jgi:hypothetical protein